MQRIAPIKVSGVKIACSNLFVENKLPIVFSVKSRGMNQTPLFVNFGEMLSYTNSPLSKIMNKNKVLMPRDIVSKICMSD